MMLKKFKKAFQNLVFSNIQIVDSNCSQTKILLSNSLIQNGKIWSSLLKEKNIKTLSDAEFKVFSQWGDDGIIQYLINYLSIENKTFVEFGVEDYQEANTRFLLINDNWSGLVMDGSQQNISKIRQDEIFWKHDLRIKAGFITAENINELIKEEGIQGEIGLLHIDIDGNDYWIWKALEVVDPIIMIVEYNSVFGSERAITVPYSDDFYRFKAHYSGLYAGASLKALCDLGQMKGYDFIGSNSAGNNAYFVKKGFCKDLKILNSETGYIESRFRESRDANGNLNYKRAGDRIEVIRDLPIYNTETNQIEKI
ncbi:hypothetical protein [Christiangramia forsetii]|uniref:Uncharacterized protein n=2 Tax=Christiangramia forsetii TaxID=411153 RepID=A0LYT7_CHRFK|nr:hypothetical protein [Christiangramia forsetii]GGG33404.1 hypothetical protein GCM10011532_16300 [Christiangramia forsetii]CAL65532.1 conserved hypothetical protein [Christiangramia forsetii KT0803]